MNHVRPQLSTRAVAISIVAFCLASFVSTIICFAVFGTYQIDVGAPFVLLLGLRVAKGSLLAMRVAAVVMAGYALIALLMIPACVLAPSRVSMPGGLLLAMVACIAGGAWAAFNVVALVRLLGRPVLAA